MLFRVQTLDSATQSNITEQTEVHIVTELTLSSAALLSLKRNRIKKTIIQETAWPHLLNSMQEETLKYRIIYINNSNYKLV